MEIDRRVVISGLFAVAATGGQVVPEAAEIAAYTPVAVPEIIPYQTPEFVMRMAFGLWHKLKADAVMIFCEQELLSADQARALLRQGVPMEWTEAFDFYPWEIIGRSGTTERGLSLHLEDGRSFTMKELQQLAENAVARLTYIRG